MSTNETPAQARLAALRAEVAALDDAETTASAAPSERRIAEVGTVMHGVSEAGVTIQRSVRIYDTASVTLYRGDEIVIDTQMLEADLNRHGQPAGWSILLHDEAEQVARWGEVRVRAGRAPHDLQPWTHGSPLWAQQREAARRAAWAEPNPGRRAAALREVMDVYGPGPTTSATLNAAKSPSERAADEQAERIRIAASQGRLNTGPSRGGE